MSTNRTEVLKAMVAQDPTNAFARYGLAMELVKGGELESAIAEFRALLEHNPSYAAAYFHGGQALEKLGDVEQAREFYEKGIEVTSRTGDQHTRSELQAALDMLPI
jgi:tetratricopeptide (TPR) repeat protein